MLGVLALRRAEDDAPPVPAEEIERLIERAAGGAAQRASSRAPTKSAQELEARGIILEDSAAGTRWKRK